MNLGSIHRRGVRRSSRGELILVLEFKLDGVPSEIGEEVMTAVGLIAQAAITAIKAEPAQIPVGSAVIDSDDVTQLNTLAPLVGANPIPASQIQAAAPAPAPAQ